MREHLQLDAPSRPELSVQAFPYESAYTELQAVCASLGPKDKVWICEKAGCALTQVIPKVGLQGSLMANVCIFRVGYALYTIKLTVLYTTPALSP